MENTNEEFEILGLNHVALVCEDMSRTIDFYTKVLGMKLVNGFDLPVGLGQHFFFSMGGRECLAFFWFADAAKRQPGISNPRANVDPTIVFEDPTALTSSHGSMNHFAFNVPADKVEAYRDKLIAKGVSVSPIMHHDDSPMQASDHVHAGTWVSSIYFQDPDGILLEFAGWQRAIGPEHGDSVDTKGATPADIKNYHKVTEDFRKQMAEA
jgi:catechol 2,3-dioxygenase-like lactoylglutathione lyase family enzyme